MVYPAYTTLDQSVEWVPRNAGLAFPEAAVIYDVIIYENIHENINVVYDPLYSASAPIKHLGCDVMWYNMT